MFHFRENKKHVYVCDKKQIKTHMKTIQISKLNKLN